VSMCRLGAECRVAQSTGLAEGAPNPASGPNKPSEWPTWKKARVFFFVAIYFAPTAMACKSNTRWKTGRVGWSGGCHKTAKPQFG
jgi:hypothetical protein